jgi:Ca-activated chloride channel family protein
MQGEPLVKAKQAIARSLKRLAEEDTFHLIRFSEDASALGPSPLPATPQNVRRGLEYLASLESAGGTMMLRGIRAALELPRDPLRRRVVSFVTDGYIGNEAEIFAEVQAKIGDARIFSFGIGASVNRHLLEGLARLGRGAAAYVGREEDPARAVDVFWGSVSRPALEAVEIDWGGMRVHDTYPRRLPDLLAGRPVIVTGRFEGAGRAALRLRGKAGGGEARELALEVDLAGGDHPGIAAVWARRRIAVLSDEALRAPHGEREELAAAIRATALEHGLLSALTAFIAVDSLSQTAGDHGTTVHVPVPVPAGVRYETTVGEN